MTSKKYVRKKYVVLPSDIDVSQLKELPEDVSQFRSFLSSQSYGWLQSKETNKPMSVYQYNPETNEFKCRVQLFGMEKETVQKHIEENYIILDELNEEN